MISIENISKSYGGKSLFEEASFKLGQRERVGLVGRNGHGKTTVFRIITGDEHADEGSVVIPRGYRIGYVRQHLDFTESTVLREGCRGLAEEDKHNHWKVEKILAGLGFTMSDMQRLPEEFSGGYQVRLNLTKVLVSEPDLLLLDEPTNYLDITSIRWIESFLLAWPHELMLITHDRGFMDKIVTHVVGIHRRRVRKIPGNTETYYSQLALEEEVYEKTRINDERRKKEIELFISRFRAKARLAGMVQSRVKSLAKMGKRDRLEEIKDLDFSFREKPFSGKYMMSARDISFGYTAGQTLIKNFSISIAAGDRICVVGRNGKGKTTLLKLLAGALEPQAGEISANPNVTAGFFEQINIKTLVDSRTVEQEVLYAAPDVDSQLARNLCGSMMFEGDAALKKIGVLSGGERSRVLLAKILATPVNLLLLDEPTNHLDMESCDALVAALDSFEGAVVMVTHNEMFLHALAQRLIVFQDEIPSVFEGSYQWFLEKGGWGDDEAVPRRPEAHTGAASAQADKLTKKELRRIRSDFFTERSRVLRPLEERMADVEADIETREAELNGLYAAMQDAAQAQNGARITEVSQALQPCRQAVDALYEELDRLTVELESQQAVFDARLAEIEQQEAAQG
jgi:ATP-binding cassette subfamily F protein 3